jgi:hypothetical protein
MPAPSSPRRFDQSAKILGLKPKAADLILSRFE